MRELTTHFEQQDILLLLKKLMLEKMSGTTTMPVDEVEGLLQSLLYVLDFSKRGSEKEFSSIFEGFEEGKRKIRKKIRASEELYKQILQTNIQLPIDSYQNLLIDIAAFFESYDIDYAAHQTGALWIDYQLAFPVDDQKLKGIDFVWSYLSSLLWENLFCNAFHKNVLLELFEAYGQQLQMDYSADINNVYDRVFFQAVGCSFAGKRQHSSLLMTEENFEHLLTMTAHQDKSQLNERFHQILEYLGLQGNAYYQKTFELFMEKMREDNHVERKHTLFIFEQPSRSLFLLNEGMTTAEFSTIALRAEQIEGEERIELLLKNFLSIYDYLDFFELGLLNTEEYMLLFNMLGVEMLTVFIKLAMRDEREATSQITSFIDKTLEETWKQQLQRYLCKLDDGMKAELNHCLGMIDLPALDFH